MGKKTHIPDYYYQTTEDFFVNACDGDIYEMMGTTNRDKRNW